MRWPRSNTHGATSCLNALPENNIYSMYIALSESVYSTPASVGLFSTDRYELGMGLTSP